MCEKLTIHSSQGYIYYNKICLKYFTFSEAIHHKFSIATNSLHIRLRWCGLQGSNQQHFRYCPSLNKKMFQETILWNLVFYFSEFAVRKELEKYVATEDPISNNLLWKDYFKWGCLQLFFRIRTRIIFFTFFCVVVAVYDPISKMSNIILSHCSFNVVICHII